MRVNGKRYQLGRVTLLCFSFLVFFFSLAGGLRLIYWNSLAQSIDKGRVFGVPQITHTFSIRNYSWRALKVGNATASCGCTVVGNLPQRVFPFMRLDVPVKVDLVGRSGPFKSSVTLNLEDTIPATFEIVAEIYAPLPSVIDVGKVRQGEVIQKSFYVEDPLDDILPRRNQLKDGVVLEFAEVDEHDVLRLEYHVPKSGGEFKVPIALSHDGHECVLKGYAFRRVEPNKSLLSLGYLQESQPATQAVTFVSPYETDFRWRPDRTRHSEYVQLKQIADGPRSTLEVTLLAPSLRLRQEVSVKASW